MPGKKKVAFITARFPFDGKEAFLCPELLELEKSIDIAIIPVSSKMQDCWFPEMLDRVARVHGPFTIATAAAALCEFAQHPLQVVKVFCAVIAGPSNIAARLRNAAIFPKALAVTRLVRNFGAAHIHAYWLSTAATVAYVASKLTGIEWSASGHRWELIDNNIRSRGRPNGGFIGAASFVRAVSGEGRDLITKALGSEQDHKVRIIHLGVELPRPHSREREVRQPGPLRIACIATLTPVKAHGVLLDALKKVKEAGTEVHCELIGNGPLREEIQKHIAAAGLSNNVTMLPQIPHGELLEQLRSGMFDAVVLTSRHEGIPVSLIEAMAAGIPVIATRAGGVPDLVNSENGILVDVDDADGIASAIIAFAADASLRERLARNGRATIEAHFSIQTTAARLAELIDQCIGPDRTSGACPSQPYGAHAES